MADPYTSARASADFSVLLRDPRDLCFVYAQFHAFTLVDFHVIPRYHASCTGARARVIALNIAYHFTRERMEVTFTPFSLMLITSMSRQGIKESHKLLL